MTDCEWMFGDAATGLLGFNALAGWNPLRWSGSKTIEQAIAEIREVQNHKDRPIIVKAPSGITTPEKKFETCQAAIDFLESQNAKRPLVMSTRDHAQSAVDDVAALEAEIQNAGANTKAKEEAERKKKEAEEKARAALEASLKAAQDYLEEQKQYTVEAKTVASKSATELETAQKKQVSSDVQANWMFGDAGRKTFGFKWAHNNPIRWSGNQPFDKTIADLKGVIATDDRPICMIAPADKSKEETMYASAQAAIEALYEMCPNHKKNKEDIVALEIKMKEDDARVQTLEGQLKEAEQAVHTAQKALSGESSKDITEKPVFPIKAMCYVSPEGKPCGGGAETSVCTGCIMMTQKDEDHCEISYEIAGLLPGKHGFHIHEKSDFTDGCNSAGPHYNPHKKTHGAPGDEERHVGDLGNIEPDTTGVAKGVIVDKLIKLYGDYSVIGRSFMVHADEDDLGLGDSSQPGPPPVNGKASKATGNAGARIACGEIKLLQFPLKAICTVSPEGKPCHGGAESATPCTGVINLEQLDWDTCKITYEVMGLAPGKHGFHIHEKADFSNGCNSAGPHYNPHGKTHGGPGDDERHVGDLGNIEPDADGIARGTIVDRLIKLEGKFSVIGRSFMVHADEDDLGKGNNDEPGPPPVNGKASKATGNAGARIACGEIKAVG